MESWTGKSIHSFMTMAISDIYALNINYRTRIVLHTRNSKGDPLQALSAVLDLLNNIKVQAIIGPETYLEAKLLAPIANQAKVPLFSFAGSTSMEYPYLFQIKEDESILAKSIDALVESYKWRDVILLYEDTERGREVLSYFLESFQDESIRISQRIIVPFLATEDQIIKEMQKLGMVGEEYAWIITYKTIDILQSEDNEIIESLQGVIGLRSYIPASSKLLNLATRWYHECYLKHSSLASREISVLAIWSYDTIWALAESVQKLGIHSSFVVPKIDLMLQNEVSKTRIKGMTWRRRWLPVTKGTWPLLINILEDSRRILIYGLTPFKFEPERFLVKQKGNLIVKGNGGSTLTPNRRTLQTTSDRVLKVGVLTRRKFTYFIDAHFTNNITTSTGFSVDVFNTCIHALPYEVPYELIPFANGTYDDLIKKVYVQEIDAILGDSTILANRSQYVDFTATYTDLGVGTLARINKNDMWIFLKTMDVDLWLSTVAFAILTGIVIFAIESMHQGSQRSPAQQIGATFWFILMTLFFTQSTTDKCRCRAPAPAATQAPALAVTQRVSFPIPRPSIRVSKTQ
ncbi:ionotropic glutamate receptor, metazoa, Periplasmic binding protein-like I [Artemisia annua]|uniref:Ionotropic glutamate receptor, metazoa, Periplasmic binding protein-like I n=1 Tax=Artemisia annua TaxID=35608 RepID=A0A2U1MV67_ARTAN|nr:ionotropic glutamate receptor, metazoa, Periplasmic binding protein-like I [Artemisia annua]